MFCLFVGNSASCYGISEKAGFRLKSTQTDLKRLQQKNVYVSNKKNAWSKSFISLCFRHFLFHQLKNQLYLPSSSGAVSSAFAELQEKLKEESDSHECCIFSFYQSNSFYWILLFSIVLLVFLSAFTAVLLKIPLSGESFAKVPR